MPNKAIFLDRDDTLIEDLGYINHPDHVKLLDGAVEALIEFGNMGYKLVVVSNQSGVARGLVSEKTLGEIHNRMKQLLVERGAYIDRVYYCPYHPDGVVAKYRKESDWRKPSPGMLLAAAEEMDIDLNQSWVIGDGNRDIEAGARAGCRTILISNPSHHIHQKLGEQKPDYKAVNLREAVNIIKKHHRSAGKTKPQNKPAQKTPAEPESQTPGKPTQQQIERTEMPPAKQQTADDSTEQLLSSILAQLKSMRRENTFGDFSGIKLLAGIVQIIVLLCLLISIGLLMRPARQDNAVLIMLMFAMVLQVMALTLYTMHRRK
jgi:D-glycero-D-manno-heptose 1,7-bisphosphate phosphatase